MDANERISEHLFWWEVVCPCRRCSASAMVEKNLLQTAAHLEEIRAALGGYPLIIVSGYRCPRLLDLWAEPNGEEHLTGRAIDFIVRDLQPYHVQKHLLPQFPKLMRGMGGFKGYTHLDWREGEPLRWRG